MIYPSNKMGIVIKLVSLLYHCLFISRSEHEWENFGPIGMVSRPVLIH